jgi:plasmid stability protein
VKNITVSLSDEAYRAARIRAAERGTSVSALVREFLESLSHEDSAFERGKRLQAEVLERIKKNARPFDASSRLTREQVHDRDALR